MRLALATLLLLAFPALAEAPSSSLRPLPREAQPVAPVGEIPSDPDPVTQARPAPRPPAATDQRTVVRVIRGSGARRAPPRPADIGRLVKEQSTVSKVSYTRKGSVCGVNAIKGVPVRSFGKPGKGCGIANPVSISSVEGVALSQKATLDCQTAKSLATWIRTSLKPAFEARGGGVERIRVAAHYACRRRNNASSGRLSEHAKGRAIDISGVRLRDGTSISVLKGWNSKAWSKPLRSVHRKACGPFGTVLGPDADRFHRDHFHFDTARYRSGAYCR